MAHHKLLLDDDLAEEFSLIAVHCSEEDYKLAYLLNKKLNLRLKRRKEDVNIHHSNGYVASYAIFEFEDQLQYLQYQLVVNTHKTSFTRTAEVSSLFSGADSEAMVIHRLLPEFDRVDYFIKISSDLETVPLRKTISLINEIQQVISAYLVDNHHIKSTNNLIFN